MLACPLLPATLFLSAVPPGTSIRSCIWFVATMPCVDATSVYNPSFSFYPCFPLPLYHASFSMFLFLNGVASLTCPRLSLLHVSILNGVASLTCSLSLTCSRSCHVILPPCMCHAILSPGLASFHAPIGAPPKSREKFFVSAFSSTSKKAGPPGPDAAASDLSLPMVSPHALPARFVPPARSACHPTPKGQTHSAMKKTIHLKSSEETLKLSYRDEFTFHFDLSTAASPTALNLCPLLLPTCCVNSGG